MMKTRNRATQKSKPRGRSSRGGAPQGAPGGGEAFSHPPQIRPQLKHRQRMRFVCITAGTQQVSFANLLDSMLVATAAVQGYQVFDTVRVEFVEMWACPAASNSPLTVSVEFSATAGIAAGDGGVYSDTSVGVTPAHVFAKPDPRANASLWNASGTGIAFTLANCPINAIVDVGVSFRNNDAAGPSAVSQALVAAQVGQFYYRGLDGQAVAATKFPAQAVLTQ